MAHCTRTISPVSLSDSQAMVIDGLRLVARGLSLWMVAVTDTVLDRLERHRQQRQLLSFDDRMLKDIGLSRADAIHWGDEHPTSPSPDEVSQ